jgi:hypothetical protein
MEIFILGIILIGSMFTVDLGVGKSHEETEKKQK